MVTETPVKAVLKKVDANRRRILLSFSLLFVILFGLGIAVILIMDYTTGYGWAKGDRAEKAVEPEIASVLGVFKRAAVSADGIPCAQIGRNIFLKNGSAVDAAIASLFCVGVVNTQSMGLGGGFFATYYNRAEKKAYVLDAREAAPLAATQDMYHSNGTLSTIGGLAVAVPGEIRGYWELYRRFGGPTPWADLIQPSIDLCNEGNPVNRHMAEALESQKRGILNEPSMRVFVDPATDDVYSEGDILYRKTLAKTLARLQREPEAINNGTLTNAFLQDLQNFGSIITREDLNNYKAKWRTPVNVTIQNGNLRLFSVPPPGSGAILAFILNVLDNYNFTKDSLSSENAVLTYHRIAEAFKYAYAKRTQMGDEDFEDMDQLLANLTSESYAHSIYENIVDNDTSEDPSFYGAVTYTADDHGTAQLSVVGPNGDAISVTSTINLYFGALIRSESTGIVLNDEMDDFSSPNITNSFELPPSPANFIKPGKRPLSSMCPAILTDSNGDVRLVIGGAGGSKISSSVAWATMQNIFFGKDIKESIDSRRLHHQLFPMELRHEPGFSEIFLKGLEEIGHTTADVSSFISALCGISQRNGTLYASFDFRKGGEVAGLN